MIIDALLKQLKSQQNKIRKPRKELIPVSTSPPPDPFSIEKDGEINITAA